MPGRSTHVPQRPTTDVYTRFSALENSEHVSKIVVYAFGAFDRYYICWMEKSGTYHQERQGLPKRLDEWLFPADGTTRDLPTLQVSLGHNDEFFAFDKFDRISNINNELRDSSSRISFWQTYAGAAPKLTLRRKSNTFSHSDMAGEPVPLSLKRASHPTKLRPRSVATIEVTPSKALQTGSLVRSSQGGAAVQRLPLTKHLSYSDAAVQTESVVIPDTSAIEDLGSDITKQMLARPPRSHTTSVSSLTSLLSNSSTETHKSDSSFSSSSSKGCRNPVYMGAMHQYFRDKEYRLGDALIRGSGSNTSLA
ncbi:uncharacterized protein Z518_08147 [Rhinocladiella mackenziei CBS 650.93]|uniref:Rhinocladiella mackenziei CBS 650.93 unplaced genomic scaffold supercont1.6, whole genome shotgun sequence n=1 Tax=Rhinocladiella mackenziei CBS 650.93 TaxID=1442369 RepID=A0A0D2GV96_9EURO|nr:uncharacterized protein Z518_08147 [Rhinocladiella mackenziei CBS 650.93]KIX02208.1 hypothetical protein Z518_08147 [Rhinocladiella mackenziei CBS 650.93]